MSNAVAQRHPIRLGVVGLMHPISESTCRQLVTGLRAAAMA